MWCPYEISSESNIETINSKSHSSLCLNYDFGPTNEITGYYYNNNNYLTPTYFYNSNHNWSTNSSLDATNSNHHSDYNYPSSAPNENLCYSASFSSNLSCDNLNMTHASYSFININNNNFETRDLNNKENQYGLSLRLNDQDLWKKFSAIGTEMIINKNGRFA